MCFGGGGSSGPQHQVLTDPNGNQYYVEQGVPLEYAQRGASTVAAYQTMASQDLSDKQIAAQQDIAAKQDEFNKQQFQYQQDQQALAQKQAQDQADRQSTYDTGRAQNLAQGTQAINDAFGQFSDDYYNKYAKDYMSQAQDQVDYQKDLATKQTSFDMARAGLTASQAHANQLGLIEETAGRTMADQTQQAQQAANTLRGNVEGAKTNLMNQLTASESIGSPIAGNTIDDVNAALQTQKSTISGLSQNALDVAASTSGVPTVSTLGNIFASALQGAGSYVGGAQSNAALTAYNKAYGGSGPTGTNPRTGT